MANEVQINASNVATAPPADSDTGGYQTGTYKAVRASFRYLNGVSAAQVRFWIKTAYGWATAFDTSQDVPLAPSTIVANGSGGSIETRDYVFGAPTEIRAQLVSLTPSGGSATVTVRLDGVHLQE